jgi:hypothetical protein
VFHVNLISYLTSNIFYTLNTIKVKLKFKFYGGFVMTFQPGAQLYGISIGTRPENVEVPHYDLRIPNTLDWKYPIGKVWVYTGNSIWMLLSITTARGVNSANWVQLQGSTFTSAGSITSTAGNITATNGNLVLGTAGNKLVIPTGTNASVGTSAAMVAGTIVVNTTAVTASSIILVSHNTLAGTAGSVSTPTASIVPGVSFTIISSSNLDTSTVNWLIIN